MEKLLFIDDEKGILDILEDYFMEFYDVYTANTFEKAIDLINSVHFDCIISDVNLVKQEGFEIVEYVKNKNKDVPVLLLSGLTEEEMIMTA